MIDFLTFIVGLVVVTGFSILVFLFAMGFMHQHLRNKGEAFGDGASKEDVEALRNAINAVALRTSVKH